MDTKKDLYDILQIDSQDAVIDEVRIILNMISPGFNIAPVVNAFNSTISLFNGTYPGYMACNIYYHDLQHTLLTFLAMARLLHGAALDSVIFSEQDTCLGLIAALFHDTGYIQEEHDKEGTGAKYTSCHVQRSMDFLERHGPEHGLSNYDISAGRAIILCTEIAVDINSIKFPSVESEFLGQLLAVADIMSQMADRIYLEKLLFLYHEFREGNVEGFDSETDLLRKTIGFYNFIAHRLESLFDKIDRFLKLHFNSRWNVRKNLYIKAISKHRRYLKKITKMNDSDLIQHLKRAGIADRVREKYGLPED